MLQTKYMTNLSKYVMTNIYQKSDKYLVNFHEHMLEFSQSNSLIWAVFIPIYMRFHAPLLFTLSARRT